MIINEDFIRRSREECFKANATMEMIQKNLCKRAEKIIFRKYRDTPIRSSGMTYKLAGVRAESWDGKTVMVELMYFTTSKLPKEKRLRLEEVKEKYQLTNSARFYNNYKVPIYFRNRYTLDFMDIVNETINLKIEA